jgi:hypothetical protein
MPTKRVPINRDRQRFSPRTIELFKKLCETPEHLPCDDDLVREFDRSISDIHDVVGSFSPLDVSGEPPSTMYDYLKEKWRRAVEIRHALIAAAIDDEQPHLKLATKRRHRWRS